MEKITDFEQIDTKRSPQDRLLFAAIFYLLKTNKNKDVDYVLRELNSFADTFLREDGTVYLMVRDGEISLG